MECQLPNELTRARKPLRSIECSDPKLLTVITQAESNKNLKSDFEAMVSFVLPSDAAANNKAKNPNKNYAGLILDAKVDTSSVGGCDRSTGVTMRFYKRAECRVLGKKANEILRRWRSGNPEAFEKSKRKALEPSNQHHPNERQKTEQDKKGGRLNETQVAHAQSVLDKKLSTLKEKKVTIEEYNASASKQFKDNVKKHVQENGGNAGSLETITNRMQSDLNSAPQRILRTINNHEASTSQELLGPPGLLGSKQSSV